MKAVWASPELRQKASDSAKAKYMEPGARERQGEILRGRKFSEEARKNMSISRKALWVKRKAEGFKFKNRIKKGVINA